MSIKYYAGLDNYRSMNQLILKYQITHHSELTIAIIYFDRTLYIILCLCLLSFEIGFMDNDKSSAR